MQIILYSDIDVFVAHNAVTMAIAYGADIRTVADRLGYAKTSTTLNVYSHAVKARNKEAAQHSPLKLGKTNDGRVGE